MRKPLKNCPKATYTMQIALRLDIAITTALRVVKKKRSITFQTQVNAILKKALYIPLNEIEDAALKTIKDTIDINV